MKLSLSTHALRMTSVLALALSLGACSKSQHLTDSVAGPGRSGAGTNVVAGCPTVVGNTPATASVFAWQLASVPKLDSRRFRIEAVGDIPDLVNIDAMGACATADIPSINFIGGHANVFIAGTTTSVSGALTFGPLLFPGAALESGVVVAQDAAGNVLEIIWPTLAGVGTGAPIVRIQLAQWNRNIVNSASRVDIAWDMVVSQDATLKYISGTTAGIPCNGSSIVPGGGAISPCPTTLGVDGAVRSQFASIPRFTATTLRAEIIGDVAAGTIGLSGPCAASATPTIQFTGGSGNMVLNGTNTSVTRSATGLTFGALLFPGALLEPGVVVATDANRNVLEIIWPAIAGTGTGAPILRLQLGQWTTRAVPGAKVDVSMRFNAVGPDGRALVYNASARGLTIPAQR